MLFKSVQPGSEELRVIVEIGKMYKAMRYSLSTTSRWQGTLRRNTFARAIRGSNSIEGYVVTAEDALAAAGGEEPLDAQRETWLAVTGYRSAMTYVLELARDPNFVFNEGFLRSLHFMMLQHDLSKHPGNWRPGPIYVRDEEKGENIYEGPPVEMVPKLIEELIAYLNGSEDKDHALVKGAMAHLNLVMIHPFSDGNGRMARCLHTLMLAVRGVTDSVFSSIEEYLGRNTRAYYNVLAEVGRGSWNPRNDTRPWIRFNLTAHFRQAATIQGRMKMIAKLWDELEREIKNRKFPERYIYALSDAAMGLHVRSAHYRNIAEVSKVVASRDLKTLVQAGMLVPAGEKRGRIYNASQVLRDMWIKIRSEEPRQIPDPFASEEALTTAF